MSKPLVKPGFMRYRRVNDILCKDPTLNNMMSVRDQIVMKPNGEKQLYPREVIMVTEQLSGDGIDPQHASRQLIMQKAVMVCQIGTGRKPVSIKLEKPKRVKPLKPKAKRTRKAAVIATDEAPVEVPPPAVDVEKSVPVQAKATMSMSQLVDGGPVTTSHEDAMLPEGVRSLPTEVKKVFAAIQVVWSQLLMALTVAEHKDKLPGWEGRILRLTSVAKEYEKLNVVELNVCAKENNSNSDIKDAVTA